jgi:hypothetical protein
MRRALADSKSTFAHNGRNMALVKRNALAPPVFAYLYLRRNEDLMNASIDGSLIVTFSPE